MIERYGPAVLACLCWLALLWISDVPFPAALLMSLNAAAWHDVVMTPTPERQAGDFITRPVGGWEKVNYS